MATLDAYPPKQLTRWIATALVLLFGIPAYAWMMRRRRAHQLAHRERIEREAFSLQRAHVPSPKPPKKPTPVGADTH